VAVDGSNNLTGINLSAGAGPFTGTLVHLSLQDALTGELLWEDRQAGHDMSLPSHALIAHHAFVMVSLKDQDATTTEYLDELTGQATSLSRQGEPMTLRAVVASENVEGIIVTPLTELAVRWLEQSTRAPDFARTYQGVSQAIARLFNIQDVWSTEVAFTNEDNFDVSDGIQAAEAYGKALALLSAMDAVTGSPQATLKFLTDQIHYDAESHTLFTPDASFASLQSLVRSAQAIWTSAHPDISLGTTLLLESLTVHSPYGDTVELNPPPLERPGTGLDITDLSIDATPASQAGAPLPMLDLTVDANLDQRLWG
jgi:hypothetical protein